MEKSQKLYLLGEERVDKALLKLGLPTMIGMLVSALYNIVDAYFVGRLGTMQMAAVSVVYPITMVGTGMGLLFGSGTGNYIARLLGKKAYDKVSQCASTIIATEILVSSILIGSALLFFEPLMRNMGATPEIMPYVRQYGILYIIGLLFNIFNVTANNLIVSEGATTYSMVAMLVGGSCNLILDPICIFGLHMGVMGAALATLISRIVSVILYVSYFQGGKSYLKVGMKGIHFSSQLYKETCKAGMPLLAFQMLIGVSVALINVQAKTYGNDVIAAFGIVTRLITIESTVVFGFIKGFQPLVGYSHGAGNDERAHEATKLMFCWSTAFTIILAAIAIIFSRQIIGFFNDESMKVMVLGRKALFIMMLTNITLGLQATYGTYFLAMGNSKAGGIISISRQGIFFIPLILILPHFIGMDGIFFAQPAADFISVIMTCFLIYKNKKETVQIKYA